MNRTELLDGIRQGHARLETALARVDPGQFGAPALHDGWSVHDLLHHIGFWEQRAARLYHALQHGESWEGVQGKAGVNELNACVLAEGRRHTATEVRLWEQQGYQTLLATAESAPEADLFDPQRFAWTGGRPFAGWIEGNAQGHIEEHLPELEAWLDWAGSRAAEDI